MGIRDRPIAPRSPWQNPYVERLIGTIRRECLDHVLIFGERHLHRILATYSSYYNETRTHLALAKDTPIPRAVQRSGTIVATPILSGLHHRTLGYDFREGQEQLLSMSVDQIRQIPGVGKASLAEIQKYRERVIGNAR